MAAVIEPSYETASITVCLTVSTSATPSGPPFWISSVVHTGSSLSADVGTATDVPPITRYLPAPSMPSDDRSIVAYSVFVAPLTSTTASPASDAEPEDGL